VATKVVKMDRFTLLSSKTESNRKLSGFILETDISDHFTTGLYPDQFKKLKSTDISRTAPRHDPRSLTYLRTVLQCVDWRPVLEDNTQTAFATFDALLNEANLICCPPTT
jgi:hypothetical protein